MGTLEETTEEMQDKYYMRIEDKILVNLRKVNLTALDIQIMEVGTEDTMLPVGTIVMNGAAVKMVMDTQNLMMDL